MISANMNPRLLVTEQRYQAAMSAGNTPLAQKLEIEWFDGMKRAGKPGAYKPITAKGVHFIALCDRKNPKEQFSEITRSADTNMHLLDLIDGIDPSTKRKILVARYEVA